MKQFLLSNILIICLSPLFGGCGTLYDGAVDASVDPTHRVPNFTFYDIKGKTFSKDNLNYGQSVLFYYVDPKCNYCHDQTLWLRESLEQMQDVQILLISTRSRSHTEKFFQRYSFNKFTNLKILYDKNKIFSTIFQVEALPCLMLYDNRGGYITSFTGLTEMANVNNAFLNHK